MTSVLLTQKLSHNTDYFCAHIFTHSLLDSTFMFGTFLHLSDQEQRKGSTCFNSAHCVLHLKLHHVPRQLAVSWRGVAL